MSVQQLPSSSPSAMRRQISSPVLGQLDKKEKKEQKEGSKPSPGIRRARSSQHLGEPIGLLVEDESISAKIERVTLENALQGKFDLATHFNEAIQKLQNRFYRYLITDHNLTGGDAAKPENKTVYESERDRLFPDGLPDGLAEGYVLGRFASQLPPDRKPKHQVLISKPVGITEVALRAATLDQGMEFVPKPIALGDFIALQNQWRQAHGPTLLPSEAPTLSSTALPDEPATESSATSSTVSTFATAVAPVLNRGGTSTPGNWDQKNEEGAAIASVLNPFHSLSLSAPSMPTGTDLSSEAGKPDEGKARKVDTPSNIDVTKPKGQP